MYTENVQFVCVNSKVLEEPLAYTRFVVMTHFGMNFVCIKETIQNYTTYIKSRVKTAVYGNVHLHGSFRDFHIR